jgi:3',5'-cyclic-AMP phosphodiesterase
MVKIVQITDTHILDDDAPSFNDFDTSASLIRTIDKIIENEADADLILLTGDLIHEPTETSYQKLADHLSVITIPIHFLPGNHDDTSLMNHVLGANGYDQTKKINMGNWLIVLLDSCLKGEQSGELSESELLLLQRTLESNPDQHSLIALHHHPVSINSMWMDSMSLINANDFFNVIDNFKQVRGIIWGHIHQEFELVRNNVKLFGTPSTCLQFKPGSEKFAVDEKSPAYRKLHLKNNGEIRSEVVYIE